MSTHAYAAEDYGMLLDRPALMTLACEEFKMTPEQVEKEGANDVFWDFCEQEGFGHISSFFGEALLVDDFGNNTDAIDSYECDTVYFIPVFRYPNLIGTRAPYENIGALVEEFRNKLGSRLPDYDIRGHICHIVGCCEG